MNENTVGREPIELVEILVPKCRNTFGSAPCQAVGTGDQKCFNTRATCRDPANFQARPAAHLDPDLILNQGDTIDTAEVVRDNDFFFAVDLSFTAQPEGCILEIGGSGDGMYFGVTSNELIFRAGSGTPSASDGPNTGRIAVPAASFVAKTVTVFGEIVFTPAGSNSISLWMFCPIQLCLTLLGTDTFTGPSEWAGSNTGGVGFVSSLIPAGESAADFNGNISSARLYNNQLNPAFSTTTDSYRQRYFFDDGRKAKPGEDLYILPLLLQVNTVGTRLNITGADGRYEPLGRRAYADIQFADAPHSDFVFDPYVLERTYAPLENSTFWPKWLVRNKFGKTRALVRRYTGYAGQTLAQMRSQTYVLDAVDWARDSARVRCRDFLSLTEFSRTQVPAPSTGRLDAAMDTTQTTFNLVGNKLTEYPATGTVRINDEIMTYTGRSYVAFTDHTEFTGVTRATDGSEAAEHDVDDSVQICRRYTNERIDVVLEEILVKDSRIPAQVINLQKITTEYEGALDAYQLTTLITEPTGADRLIGELAEQCSFYIWWDERAQVVDMQAIKPLTEVDANFTEAANIIGDSFEIAERPKERVSTVALFYNPRDFAGPLNKPTNYANLLIVAIGSDPDQHDKLPQIREIFSRWLTTEAQMNQTGSRIAVRYADVPQYVSFLVDAKDRQYWVGDFCTIDHRYLVTATGAKNPSRRWLIVEAEEPQAGHNQRLVATDVTLDGIIYVITENDVGTYTPELFAQRLAFIGDNSGLNPDGTPCATIG